MKRSLELVVGSLVDLMLSVAFIDFALVGLHDGTPSLLVGFAFFVGMVELVVGVVRLVQGQSAYAKE